MGVLPVLPCPLGWGRTGASPRPSSLPKDNEETGRVREGGEARVSEKGRKGGRGAWSE